MSKKLISPRMPFKNFCLAIYIINIKIVSMKTIAKIDPEKEYENAKKTNRAASKQALGNDEPVL
ncbi:MAG: hypothetical protein U0T83_08640 [Bacteriovoracaceae bacterium]